MRRRRHRNKRGKNHTVRNIVISCFVITLLLATGYSTFQTVININVKGNIKDLKQEVDSKVPTNDLLFWGQADNSENTLTILKDKSSHANDGRLNNFDNTSTSGFYDGKLIFDGVDDYVDIGYANYDFKNSQSYVMYLKLNNLTNYQQFFGNWQNSGGGGGFGCQPNENGPIYYNVYDGDNWQSVKVSKNYIIENRYYTWIGTYNGTNLNFYINGSLVGVTPSSQLTISSLDIFLGANPNMTGSIPKTPTNMSLKEAMLYDRALTEVEVRTITDGFNRKYNKNTTN